MLPNLSEVEKLLKLVYPILHRHSPELIPILKNPVLVSVPFFSRKTRLSFCCRGC
mgnify:CR=1 FL=1